MAERGVEEEGRPDRVKTLTAKGSDLFQERVSAFKAKLTKLHEQLIGAVEERSHDPDSLHEKSEQIRGAIATYELHSQEFIEYLQRINTEESQREVASHSLIVKNVCSKAYAALRGIDVIERSLSYRHAESNSPAHSDIHSVCSVSVHSCKSKISHASSVSSLRIKQRAKVEAARTELEFASQEAEMKRAKALAVLRQSNIDTDLEVLKKKRDAAVADAELRALSDELEECDVGSDVLKVSSDGDVMSNTQLNVNSSPFVPISTTDVPRTILFHDAAQCDIKLSPITPTVSKQNSEMVQSTFVRGVTSSGIHPMMPPGATSNPNVAASVCSHHTPDLSGHVINNAVSAKAMHGMNLVPQTDSNMVAHHVPTEHFHNSDSVKNSNVVNNVPLSALPRGDVYDVTSCHVSKGNPNVPTQAYFVHPHVVTDLPPGDAARNAPNSTANNPFVGPVTITPSVPTSTNHNASYAQRAIFDDAGHYSDLSRFLMKKDLMLTRLTNFDDQAESYLSWKNSFKAVMLELNVSPSEELDLLVKYLGKDSSKWAVSLRGSNAGNPGRGMLLTWERLDERFGSPELIEAALKVKLAKFTKILPGQNKRLYDLADILTEIESVMNNPIYQQLFAYYNTSSGINPIVAKLPSRLKDKWTSRAMRYKTTHGAIFPPYSELCAFVREMSTCFNDPAFADQLGPTSSPSGLPKTGGQAVVSSRKTGVGPDGKECPLHYSDHSLNDCRGFRKKSFSERKKILRENHHCFRCCESNAHVYRNCTASIRCVECGSESHPTALHINGKPMTSEFQPQTHQGGETHGGETRVETASEEPITSKCTKVCGNSVISRSCAKTLLVKVYPATNPEKSFKVYAILDDQSNQTLGSTELFDMMDVTDADNFQYKLTSCSGCVTKSGRKAAGWIIESLDEQHKMALPPVIECEIPDERNEIPTPEIVQHFQHLSDVDIPPLDKDAQISLLIGRDLVEAHIVLEQRTGRPKDPFAQRLALGWAVIGNVCLGRTHKSEEVVVTKTHIRGDGRPTAFEPCPYNLKVEENNRLSNIKTDPFIRTIHDDTPGPSIEDNMFMDLMDREVTKESGHWTAPLPFRAERPRLPNNRPLALKRAKSLQRSLQRDPVKRQHFVTFMEGALDKGHAELARSPENGEEVWYLPLFGVYHPKKKDKIRVVFDSSAKYQGVSLNSVLMTGPDLTNNLVGVLLRFRRDTIGIIADIEQMFYGFYVAEKDRNYLRFLWHKDNDPDEDIVEYRMCVHVFGNSPSPAVATYGLRKCVQSARVNCEEHVRQYVTRNFYVDDGLGSFPTASQAICVLKDTQHTLESEGKLRLHKIASNSQEVMAAFPMEDLASGLKNLDLCIEQLPLQHSLGLCWDINSDSFTFKLSDDRKPPTRRGILAKVNSLFDPLGFLAPVTIYGKILLRDIVAETRDWDQPLPEDTLQIWKKWETSLQPLEGFSLSRCFVPTGISLCEKAELHVFSDASEKAIAAVSYIRTVDASGRVQVGFVCGKSKVAPKHGHTIPRLELCAAVLAVELGDMLSEQLDIARETVRYHTDSQVVLGYLYNEERRFFIYVTNRVGRIRQSSSPKQWSYVPTGENPADQGTRHVPPEQIAQSMWIKGPPFLEDKDPSTPYDHFFSLIDPEHDKEIKQVVSVCKTGSNSILELGTDRFKKFSAWRKLITAISRLQHIVWSFHQKDEQECHGWHTCDAHKSPECASKAERFIIAESQRESFREEVAHLKSSQPLNRDSTVIALSPYLDESGIMRVGGRLRHSALPCVEKNPILISGRHYIAILIIRHFHQSIQHQGRHFTEGAVRAAGFWITGGKRLISRLLYECVKCRRMRGKASQQQMANLPPDRLTSSPPFTFVGVDVFGPWEIVTRRTRGGSANSKRWGVMFTCLGCRAIHIELIEEMSASSFINALPRFYALRGSVKEFRSDRGTNFVGSIEELQIDAVNIEDQTVRTLLNNSGTVWKFNAPHSSHMGGSWERMIGTTRRILDSVLLDHRDRAKLTHEILSTLMAEVCAIVNSRPLVPVSSDVENPCVLSPATLLTQKGGNLPEQLPNVNVNDMYHSQWKCVQVLANSFWVRWRREYLQTLQTRKKWEDKLPNLKVGDVVLLRDVEVHRNQWPLGIINRVFEGDDGLVRKLEVRIMRDGTARTYVRPIKEVVLLLD